MGGGRDAAAADVGASPATAAAAEDAEAAAALLLRLQSQFGDLDLSSLGGAAGAAANAAKADTDGGSDAGGRGGGGDRREETGRVGVVGGVGGGGDGGDDVEEGDDDDSSEESEDPSPEEIRAWQEAQYKLARWAREAREEAEERESGALPNALRRRRRRGEVGEGGAEEGWESVHPPPDLDGQGSAFFVTTTTTREQEEDDLEFVEKPGAGGGVGVGGDGGVHPLLARLAAADPEVMGGKWRRLYSSDVDGLSFRHLLAALHGYDGPTVLLVGTAPSAAHSRALRAAAASSGGGAAAAAAASFGRGTLGFFTASPWREASDFYGTDDCFLFRAAADGRGDVRVFRPAAAVAVAGGGGRRNFMYCYPTPSASHGGAADGRVAHGIGMGGTKCQPRLHITESLEGCRALPWDGTFEAGGLLPNPSSAKSGKDAKEEKGEEEEEEHDSLYYFDVDALEVWGVGGRGWIEGALKSRRADRERIEAARRRARMVDKTQLMDDFRSGLVESEALFGHSEHSGGRVDVCEH